MTVSLPSSSQERRGSVSGGAVVRVVDEVGALVELVVVGKEGAPDEVTVELPGAEVGRLELVAEEKSEVATEVQTAVGVSPFSSLVNKLVIRSCDTYR